MTVIALIPVSKRAAITLAENGLVVFGIGLVSVIVMLVICVTLFQYKRELRGMEEKPSLAGGMKRPADCAFYPYCCKK